MLAATGASAQEPSGAEPDERTWYGWQTLAVDVATLSVFDVAVLSKQDVVAGVGMGGFVLGSPALHLAHGNTGPGLVSLSSHGVMPFGGFALAQLVLHPAHEMASRTKTVIGVTVGGVAAAAIDAVWLAWVEPPSDAVEVHVGLAPWVSEDGKGVGLALRGGAF